MNKNIQKIIDKYNNKAIEDYGSVNSPAMKQFASYVKRQFKAAAIEYGFELDTFNVGHYDISGFFRKDNVYVYFSYDVPRGNYPMDLLASDCINGWLYRTAKSNKDYTGGSNNFSNMYYLMDNIQTLFERTTEKCLPEEIKLVLDMELKDDETPFGGKTYSDETVKDFIWEAYENDEIKKLTFERLNRDLQKNGILPINKTDLLPEKIKSLLNYTLKDIEDEPFEGTLFNGETLKYFLEFHEIEDILKMKTLDDLNRDLTFSGLMPISLDKEFTVTIKVQGRYITTVMAKDLTEAKERAMNNWIEADIGDIEETDGTIVAIDDAMDNRVFENLD